MQKTKYKLSFEVEALFDITNEMEASLFDGSKIILSPSKGKNLGTIYYEMDKPDINMSEIEGQSKVENFFTYLLYIKDNFEDLKQVAFLKEPELLNAEDFKGQRRTISNKLKIIYQILSKLNQEEIDDTSKLLLKMLKLPQDDKAIIDRSMRWFRKASETNGEDRFIYRWISFDALLGLINIKSTPKLIIKSTPS